MSDAIRCPRCGEPATEVPLRVRFESEQTARALRCDPCGGVQLVCSRCGVAMAEDAAAITDDSSGKPHAGSRCPKCRARSLRCPHCAGPMFESDKNTMTGRDMRTFWCGLCGETLDVDAGIALSAALAGGSMGGAPARESARQPLAGHVCLGLAAYFAALTAIYGFAGDLGIALALGLSAIALGAGGVWLIRRPARPRAHQTPPPGAGEKR